MPAYIVVEGEQLNQVAKAVFPKAYGKAQEEFRIVPGKVSVGPGMSVALKTSPYTEVTWKVIGRGSIVDGLYTAPEAAQGQVRQEIQVVAVPKDPNIAAAVARVMLTAMAINGPVKVACGAVLQYQAAPEPNGGIDWSFVPPILGAAISKAGIFTAPSKAEAEKAGPPGRVRAAEQRLIVTLDQAGGQRRFGVCGRLGGSASDLRSYGGASCETSSPATDLPGGQGAPSPNTA